MMRLLESLSEHQIRRGAQASCLFALALIAEGMRPIALFLLAAHGWL